MEGKEGRYGVDMRGRECMELNGNGWEGRE